MDARTPGWSNPCDTYALHAQEAGWLMPALCPLPHSHASATGHEAPSAGDGSPPPRQPWHHRWVSPPGDGIGRCTICHAVKYSEWPYAFDCPGDGTWRKPIRVEWHGILKFGFVRPSRNIQQLAREWLRGQRGTSKRRAR